MPWHVVEKHTGYQVLMAPAQGAYPPKYFARFAGDTVHRTPFRLTQQQARHEGQVVSDQITRRCEQVAAAVRRAMAAPLADANLHDMPDMDAEEAALFAAPDLPKQRARLAQEQRQAAAGAAAGAVGLGDQQHLHMLLSAAGASALLTGGFVSLGICYNGGMPGSCVQLGHCLGSGGFADVYQGTLVQLSGVQLSNPQQVAAAAAKQWQGLLVAVKVFRSSKPGTAAVTLQKCVSQELEALRHLQFHGHAVQLLAEGAPVSLPASSTLTAAGSSLSQTGSSKRKRKFGKDASSLQLPYCAVLELCPQSLQDALRKGRCSEDDAWYITVQLVEFLDYCQCGKLGCIIVHRDLKPSNILLRASGSVAVSDFGACCIVKLPATASEAAATAAGDEGSKQHLGEEQQHALPSAAAAAWPDPAVVAAAAAAHIHTGIGTPFYTAPEVYSATAGKAAAAAACSGTAESNGGGSGGSSNNKRSYDASVDVFALGVIVVEMLLGSLHGLCEFGAPKSAAQVQQWEQRLQALVDGEMLFPEGVVVSSAALQFIGCCCGVGRERVAAAARGEPKRLTPAQLKTTTWLQQQR